MESRVGIGRISIPVYIPVNEPIDLALISQNNIGRAFNDFLILSNESGGKDYERCCNIINRAIRYDAELKQIVNFKGGSTNFIVCDFEFMNTRLVDEFIKPYVKNSEDYARSERLAGRIINRANKSSLY